MDHSAEVLAVDCSIASCFCRAKGEVIYCADFHPVNISLEALAGEQRQLR